VFTIIAIVFYDDIYAYVNTSAKSISNYSRTCKRTTDGSKSWHYHADTIKAHLSFASSFSLVLSLFFSSPSRLFDYFSLCPSLTLHFLPFHALPFNAVRGLVIFLRRFGALPHFNVLCRCDFDCVWWQQIIVAAGVDELFPDIYFRFKFEFRELSATFPRQEKLHFLF